MPDTPGNPPTASTPRPPFPWWLVGVLGGGLLLVVGIVAAFFLRGNPLPGLGAFCAQQEPRCARGLVCSEDNLCLRAEGTECARGEECASHQCLQGSCQAVLSGPGGTCDEDSDCARPAVCEADVCLLPDGQACTEASACRSQRCEGGLCAPRVEPGGACREHPDCAGPARCEEGRCLLPDASPCTRAALCDSGRCENGVCQPPVGLGESCRSDRNCREPTRCHLGMCLRPDGTACNSAAQCISGRCDQGACLAAVAPGGRCAKDGDCQRPGQCDVGLCRLPDGQKCGGDVECLSSRCVQGACRARVAGGGACQDTGDCVPQARCTNNLCLFGLGTQCGRDVECQSGNCERGICRRGCTPACGSGFDCFDGECRRSIVVPGLRPCTADSDCSAQSRCNAGRCRRLAGESCATSEQCISRSCVNERCR